MQQSRHSRLTCRRLRNINTTLVLMIFFLAVACSSAKTDPGTLQVMGIVTSVESSSLTDLAALTVIDTAGTEWRFVAAGFVGMTPSHLREHQATREPIRVIFSETPSGELTVERIDDE